MLTHGSVETIRFALFCAKVLGDHKCVSGILHRRILQCKEKRHHLQHPSSLEPSTALSRNYKCCTPHQYGGVAGTERKSAKHGAVKHIILRALLDAWDSFQGKDRQDMCVGTTRGLYACTYL